MQGVLQGLVFMGAGDWGAEVTRKDGSRVPYVSLYDEESDETFKLSCDPGWDGALPKSKFSAVNVRIAGSVHQEASVGAEGRAFARGAKPRFRVVAIEAAS